MTATGVTTRVVAVTPPDLLETGIALGHAVTPVTTVVTVDVAPSVVGTPLPIAMAGPTPVPDLDRSLQPRVITAETGAGITVGIQASLTPTWMPETCAGSCLTQTIGRNDIMLWHASPYYFYYFFT